MSVDSNFSAVPVVSRAVALSNRAYIYKAAAACTIGTFTHVVCNFYMVAYCSSAGLGLLMIGKTTDKSMNSVPTSSRCICFQVSVLKFVCVRVINFWLAMPAACTVLLLKIAFSANRLVSIV